MAGCQNCCYGWGILDCFPASMEACFALVIAFVVVFAILCITYGFLAATMAIQRIWQRHYHILTKRELTKVRISSRGSGRDTTTSSPRGNSKSIILGNLSVVSREILGQEYIVEDLHGCYAAPKLDPAHEERLKMLNGYSLPPTGKGKRGKSADIRASLEARLQRVEFVMADNRDKVEDIDQRIDGLKGGHEEFHREMQGILNSLAESWKAQMDALKDSLQAEITAMKEEIKKAKGDWSLCKMAVTQGNISSSSSPKVDIPRPKSYNGSRNTRELDKFIRGVASDVKFNSVYLFAPRAYL
ncbi:RING/FYVE/PHD zinc finger superfamily protein [Actinidia rufa]|uniref:RING/FYVE/PHD zinc finger superfamily protein n=1 Tax=Actinidia rufa TaxID=165716 RepID=A0A7J0E340_9ERIC|nr:RING/FYVE/PHD zinc finger superfamily protein [Actinidia rufa]